MKPQRIAIVSDFLEEQWPSMDLVADVLLDNLRLHRRNEIEATLIRPPFVRRLSRVSRGFGQIEAFNADRVLNRFFDYPRIIRKIAAEFDLFHIVDHSYSHLVHDVRRRRAIVTCHDLDTFRSVLKPAQSRRSPIIRAMTRRILSGFQSAAIVICDTDAVRDEILSYRLVPAERLVVIRCSIDRACSPNPDPIYDQHVTQLLGPPRPNALDLLHVASTIPRKRIDILLQLFAAVRQREPLARLIRVGGPFTAPQRRMVEDLQIGNSIVVVPFLTRRELAAVYRRATILLMPSEAEGFGLPVVEAMASGTPVVATDLAVLREVGGRAAEYCGLSDTDAWTTTVCALAAERREQPRAWATRRINCIRRAGRFGSKHSASQHLATYLKLAASDGLIM